MLQEHFKEGTLQILELKFEEGEKRPKNFYL